MGGCLGALGGVIKGDSAGVTVGLRRESCSIAGRGTSNGPSSEENLCNLVLKEDFLLCGAD